ncbi:zinc dependent phospholipase C family protein [Caniella muris]|uniref:zinc dependent phospholipase C family protein n=1 Tax=Caniella muris TaxID=2941502 RepID=UPI00203A81A0|nr:zinc dependent phospholipase C family protein [Caniella muris]
MPALITHHIFGEKCAPELPEGLVEDQEQLLAFLLGNQGPDPFFFRFRALPAELKACHRLATSMHSTRVAPAFAAAHESVGRLPEDEQGLGRAFCLGLVAHYQLDRSVHPFIFAEQDEIIDASDGELEGCGSQVHAVIEGRIDSWMLWKERHSTVLTCHPALELCRTPRIDRVAGAIFSQVAWQVFGISISCEEFGAAVDDMQAVYRLIEPAGSPRGEAVALVEERLRGTFSQVEAMAHEVLREDVCPLANPRRLPWTDPFTGRVSHASFMDLFDGAVDGFPVVAEAFCRGGDAIETAVGGLNYSGKR